MKIKTYESFNETLYTKVLKNGLKVNILPKKDYERAYGIITTDYGSIDNEFVPYAKNEMKKFPAGIAHFLEHKLFEKENYDAFELFGKYGADSNAFTSFTRTSYLFSASQNIKESLKILLDFVFDPYFSKKSVEKEKGIIGQEIMMYQDEPGWQLYSGILSNLYPQSALSDDIAGTVESISKITVEDLYACYETFYQPQNMNLFLVGNYDVNTTFKFIDEIMVQKEFQPIQKINRKPLEIKPVIKERVKYMEVQRPKIALGIRGLESYKGKEGLKFKMKMQLLLSVLLGENSKYYLDLYNQNVVDDSFGFDFQLERGFNFALLSTNTSKVEDFISSIQKILKNSPRILTESKEEFELEKREFLGSIIKSMDSLESIANRYEGKLFDDATIFDMAEILEEIRLDDLIEISQKYFDEERMSVFKILPKEK